MRALAVLSLLPLLLNCAGSQARQASASASADEPSSVTTEDPEPSAPTEADDAAPGEAPASTEPPAYQEPPPVVVRRYHVFATLETRAKQKVTLTSLLTTAADDAEALAPGIEALLEHKPAGAEEWVPVADVTVTAVTTRGNRVAGTERQVIEVQLLREHAAASLKGKLSPFARKGRVRLQVDRPAAQPTAASPP